MNSINVSRFFLLFKKQVREDWKRQLIILCIISIIITIIFRLVSITDMLQANNMSEFSNTNTNQMPMIISAMLSMIILCICFIVLSYHTAHSMPYMQSRQQHIQHMLIPASKTEKFLVSLLYPIISTIVICIPAILLADAIQFFFSSKFIIPTLFSTDFKSISQSFTSNISTDITNITATVIAQACCIHAWCLLAATIFRKHPFLIGFVIYNIATSLISVAFMPFSLTTINNNDINSMMSGTWYSVGIITYFGAAIIMYFIAYKRSYRIQA